MNPIVPGAYTALVTPFDADGVIDEAALLRLVDFQLAGGIDGLVLCGGTGEEATVPLDDRRRMAALVHERVGPDFPLILGASSNSTAEAVDRARAMEQAGADAILSVVPYYNRPNQEGVVEHFSRIAEAVSAPVIATNVPSRTGCPLAPETALRLAESGAIAGVDEGSGDLAVAMAIIKDAPAGFRVFSGEDALTLPMTLMGGAGVLSIVSNQMPAAMTRMVHHALAGELADARRLHDAMFDLMALNYIDTNPMPVKAALAMMGLIGEHFRAPMRPLAADQRAVLATELRKLDLIDQGDAP